MMRTQAMKVDDRNRILRLTVLLVFIFLFSVNASPYNPEPLINDLNAGRIFSGSEFKGYPRLKFRATQRWVDPNGVIHKKFLYSYKEVVLMVYTADSKAIMAEIVDEKKNDWNVYFVDEKKLGAFFSSMPRQKLVPKVAP